MENTISFLSSSSKKEKVQEPISPLSPSLPPQKKHGGWKAVRYILGNTLLYSFKYQQLCYVLVNIH